MSFFNAFPPSPLSRSALASERDAVEAETTSATRTTPSKPYGHVAATSFASHAPPSRLDAGISAEGNSAASPYQAAASAAPSSRHVSGPARLMRSPFTPSWSLSSNSAFNHDTAFSPPRPSSSFTRSVNTRRRSSGFSSSAASPTPNFGSLVGSFQESLLCGRMSMPASKPVIFDAEIGVLGVGRCKPSLRCPPHVHIQFPAHFYDFHAMDASASASRVGSTAALGSPYVGTIDLDAHYHATLLAATLATGPSDLPSFPGYAVPPKGQVQLVVKYPELNAVKLFLVPYDLTDMQPGTKTFIRQKTMSRSSADPNDDDHQHGHRASPNNVRVVTRESLRFAIHLQFCCPPVKALHDDRQAGFDGSDSRRFRQRADHGQKSSTKAARSPKIFLHKTIRLVFGARALDSGEKLVDQVETPGQGAQRFASYNGPDEEWYQLHHQVEAAQACSAESFKSSLHANASFNSLENGWNGVQRVRTGCGVAIQNAEGHEPRPRSDDAEERDRVPPLNSDPNGERWQPSSSFAKQSAIARPPVGDAMLPSTAAWTYSSQGSSVETLAGRWPRPAHLDDQDVHQLARSLANTCLTEAFKSHQDDVTPEEEPATHAVEPAASTAQSGRPALPPSMRPSRIRSASSASLSEACVQSVSALGRLQEAAAAVSADSSSFSPRATSDRPSLIRKLSEQFARSHTPSPTASPSLKATLRHADDEAAPVTVDDIDGTGDGASGFAVKAPWQPSTSSIR
ncbi:hypothetical protein EX895_005103 [Sporisorium graminicola]|uniref:Atos-like conserved domain-containing protein n=1 Tax=Sporisorium graminicola TaxID=280036 RepID=A0A4U7KSN4_9BASI|nr:hypothetical protein EX895_005103 [Sporisorium graminicola]TKY86278.1 hypothetical protein EX895_005103 [Sporisorium graminicola]